MSSIDITVQAAGTVPAATPPQHTSHEFFVFEAFREHYDSTGFRVGLTEDELAKNTPLPWRHSARKRRAELMAKGLVEPIPLADPTRPYIWDDVRLLDPSLLSLHTGEKEKPLVRAVIGGVGRKQSAWRLTRYGISVSKLPIEERRRVVRGHASDANLEKRK